MNRRAATAVLVLLLPFGAAVACSQADQDAAETRTSELAADAERSASSLITEGSAKAKEMEPGVREQLNDTSRDAREAALRNATATGGAAPFEDRGVPIDGNLECTATSTEVGQYEVRCTGRAEDGRAVELVGTDPGQGNSNWVGKVEGTELFNVECVAVC